MDNVYIRFTISLLIILINLNNIFASQSGSIEGKVIESTSLDSIPFATIELLHNSDSSFVKGTLSDITGTFAFEELQFGRYWLRVSYLGYEKRTVSNLEISTANPNLTVGAIQLHPDSKQLKEVVIKGPKISGVIKDNKTIYQIKEESAAIAQSGLDLLRQLPDITVSHFFDEVKLAGRSNIHFQVNGRKVNKNYLMQLNPELIAKIEVMTTPGVEYELATDAVINILLKRQFQKGMSGSVRLNSSTSGKALMSKNNANTDYYLNNLRLYIAARYKQKNLNTETISKKNTVIGKQSYSEQHTYGNETGNSLALNFGTNWFMNENNTFSFSGSIQPIGNNKINATTANYSSDANKEESSTFHSNTSDSKAFYDYSIHFQHNFPQKTHNISFEAYGSNRINNNNSEHNEYHDTSTSILLNNQKQTVENTNKYAYLKINYIFPIFGSLKMSTGYNNYQLCRDHHYKNLLLSASDKTIYKEVRHGAYMNLSTGIGSKTNMQSGIRYEYSNTNIRRDRHKLNQYHFLSPSLTLTHKTGKLGIFRFSYRRSIGRPGINQLSPAVYANNSYTHTIGNPGLKPSKFDRIEFEHRITLKNSTYINYKPYFTLTKSGIRQVKQFESDSLEIRQYQNIGKQLEYGINISGSALIKKMWTITPSFTWYSRNTAALPVHETTADISDNSWRMHLSSQLILPENWILFLECNYEAPVRTYQNRRHEYYDFVLGFVKPVNKNLSISAFTLNPWTNQYMYDKRSFTANNTEQLISHSMKYDYMLFIKMNYKFKSGKVGKKHFTPIEQDKFQKSKKGIFE